MLFFQRDFMKSKWPVIIYHGVGKGGGGIEGSWLDLFSPKVLLYSKIPFICNQCSIISTYCMITYDYVLLRIIIIITVIHEY